jgi:hypothetical protein
MKRKKARDGKPKAKLAPAMEPQTAKDDTEITALAMHRGKLSPAREA